MCIVASYRSTRSIHFHLNGVTADHSFTDGNISITFDNSGSTTDYSSSIKHADVGTITDSLSNLDSAEVTIIDNVYSEVNDIEEAVSSIQSTTTIEDAAPPSPEGWRDRTSNK